MDFYTQLRNILDRHAPLVTQIYTAHTSAPWITEEVNAAKCNLREAERQWRSSGLTVHSQMFLEQITMKKGVILSADRKHYCETLSECNSNKQLYGLTKELLGNGKRCVFPRDIPES